MTMQIANPFSGLDQAVQENVPLAKFTWYKIGGPARWFVQPRSVEELREASIRCLENGIPVYVLAWGPTCWSATRASPTAPSSASTPTTGDE